MDFIVKGHQIYVSRRDSLQTFIFFYKLMLINSPSTKFYRSRKLSGKLNTKSGNATHYFPIYICKRQLPRLIYYTTYHRILNY